MVPPSCIYPVPAPAPLRQFSNSPTFQQVEKSKSQQTGKLASWHPLPGGGAPPRLTRPRRPTFHPCTRQASRIVVSSSPPPAPRSPTCPLSLPAGRPPPVPPTPTRPPAVTRLNPPHPVIARLRSPPPNPAHSVITPPGLPFLRARTYRPPAAPRHRANSPTSQQIDKSKSRKVGKLAHTTNPQGRGNPPRNAAKTSRPLPPRIVHTSSHPRPALALPRR